VIFSDEIKKSIVKNSNKNSLNSKIEEKNTYDNVKKIKKDNIKKIKKDIVDPDDKVIYSDSLV
jgi:hypothetical protein